MILYFSVQLVEKLGGLPEKWEGLSPPPYLRPCMSHSMKCTLQCKLQATLDQESFYCDSCDCSTFWLTRDTYAQGLGTACTQEVT